MDNNSQGNLDSLNEEVRYTVSIFELNKSAREFIFWYENIFKQENSNSSHFDFNIRDDNGETVLEVMQFNPYFPVDALITMFEGYQMEKRDSVNQPVKVMN